MAELWALDGGYKKKKTRRKSKKKKTRRKSKKKKRTKK